MQENGIFSSGSPPTAECVRTLMSARRTLPAKSNFSNFLQFFLFLDSPDWVIISIFQWDINECKLSGLWALPQYKRWSQVRRCLLSSGYYCQNQKEIRVKQQLRGKIKAVCLSCLQVSYRLIEMSVKQWLEMKIIYDPKKMLPQYFWSGLRPRGRACKQM